MALSAETTLRWSTTYNLATLRVLFWLHAQTERSRQAGDQGWTEPLSQRSLLEAAGVSPNGMAVIMAAVAAEAEVGAKVGRRHAYRLLGDGSEVDPSAPSENGSESDPFEQSHLPEDRKSISSPPNGSTSDQSSKNNDWGEDDRNPIHSGANGSEVDPNPHSKEAESDGGMAIPGRNRRQQIGIRSIRGPTDRKSIQTAEKRPRK